MWMKNNQTGNQWKNPNIGRTFTDAERQLKNTEFVPYQEVKTRELCPRCGDCNFECDNCSYCGTDTMEPKEDDMRITEADLT